MQVSHTDAITSSKNGQSIEERTGEKNSNNLDNVMEVTSVIRLDKISA